MIERSLFRRAAFAVFVASLWLPAASASTAVTPVTLVFGNQPLGTTSAAQTITVKNNGTSSITVTSATTAAPFSLCYVQGASCVPYPITGVSLAAGASLKLHVTFFATFATSFTGTVTVSYSGTLPSQGTSLQATGVSATGLQVTNFPVLPSATLSDQYANTPYTATLTAADTNMTGSFIWALAPGSNPLPPSLSLSTSGVISGIVTNTASTTNINVQVTHNSQTTVVPLTLPVAADPCLSSPPICANSVVDFVNVPNTSTPITPLNDLATNKYLTYQGGLYPNGLNSRPQALQSAGTSRATAIKNTPGPIVLLSIGFSNPHLEFSAFKTIADTDPAKYSQLVIVDGAEGSQSASMIEDPTAAYWQDLHQKLQNAPGGPYVESQVAAIWLKETDFFSTGTPPPFPGDSCTLHSELESILNLLSPTSTALPYPFTYANKVVYLTSRTYAGYENATQPFSPETYAYETGFAVKWAIEDELRGHAGTICDDQLQTGYPWFAWGPYIWTDGLLARSDGLTWSAQDVKGDGRHPSDASGQPKVANILLNFFKTDSTASPWFLMH